MSAPALDTRPGSGVSLAAFVGDDDTTAKLNNIANFHWPGAVINRGGCHDAGTYLKSAASPDLLVVDLGESENPFEDLQPLAELCDPSTQVIAMGVVNDLALYKQFINAGVADYLVKPLSEEDLETALLAATFSDVTSGEKSTNEPSGKIVVTIGARGGVGASTVALNGAWLLAEEMGHKVALVDLDLQFGTAALSLDLVPSTGMIETLRQPDRMDSLFMQSAVLPKTEHLSVLAAEEDLARQLDLHGEGIGRLVEELRSNFDWVWLDLPRSLCHLHTTVLRDAAHVQVVSDLTLAGMRDTMRIVNLFSNIGGDGEIGVIINHARRNKGMPKGEFTRGVGCQVYAQLPDEPKALQAATVGKPLAQSTAKGKFITELRKVTADIAPTVKEPKRGLFSSRKAK
ncbi:MAG: AAA family ATPase [Alphaproteobacteria bacterium]|nr:AAA family ATPase [Alphaproteobacteria bacterium]